MQASPMAAKYDITLDRESAYELLAKRATEAAAAEQEADRKSDLLKELDAELSARRRFDTVFDTTGKSRSVQYDPSVEAKRRGPTITEQLTRTVVKELSGTTGRKIVRGILGGLFKS
jgi:hypothetical protein